MGVKITNNAAGTLSAAITSSATTLTLTSGQGALFPTLSVGDYCWCTLVDTSNNVEVIKVTARSTDTLTMTRGQDNTTAQAFAINDRLELRPTAALFAEFADPLPSITDNGNATAITIDSSENVGIGVVPEAWSSGQTALQVGGVASISGDTTQVAGNSARFLNNAYHNAGWKYQITDEATYYAQYDGTHVFKVAPSGTADSAISWTTGMTIDNSGNTTVKQVSADKLLVKTGGEIEFDFNGFSSHFTAGNSPHIFSGQGSVSPYYAGTLNLQTRPSLNRNINFITGSSPSIRASITTDGITFNGDTAAANALDDYEEGTFTPSVTDSDSAQCYGSYVKIGSLVTLNFIVGSTNSTSTSNINVSGLPYSVDDYLAATSHEAQGSVSYPTNFPNETVACCVARDGTYIDFRALNLMTGKKYSDATGSWHIRASITYRTNS